MALFNRNKSEPNKLPELEWYNEGGRRVKTWVLALGALIAAGLIIAGLFFGGRWVYRQVTKDDAPVSTQTETATNKDAVSPDAESTLNSINTTPTHTDTSSNSSTASTAATNRQLANTGPSGIIYAFIVTSVIGTVLFRVRLQSNQDR